MVVTNDLTGDGDLDIIDIAQAQKIYLELINNSDPGFDLKIKALDLNNNGVDIIDVARLQKVYLGL